MMRIEASRGEVLIHVDDEGCDLLAEIVPRVKGGNKAFLGDPGSMLIIRHADFHGTEEAEDEHGGIDAAYRSEEAYERKLFHAASALAPWEKLNSVRRDMARAVMGALDE